MSCAFYGQHMVFVNEDHMDSPLRLLVPQGGNQCALITDSYSPCVMQLSGDTPTWSACPLKEGIDYVYGTIHAKVRAG